MSEEGSGYIPGERRERDVFLFFILNGLREKGKGQKVAELKLKRRVGPGNWNWMESLPE